MKPLIHAKVSVKRYGDHVAVYLTPDEVIVDEYQHD